MVSGTDWCLGRMNCEFLLVGTYDRQVIASEPLA